MSEQPRNDKGRFQPVEYPRKHVMKLTDEEKVRFRNRDFYYLFDRARDSGNATIFDFFNNLYNLKINARDMDDLRHPDFIKLEKQVQKDWSNRGVLADFDDWQWFYERSYWFVQAVIGLIEEEYEQQKEGSS